MERKGQHEREDTNSWDIISVIFNAMKRTEGREKERRI
jgi:hypothetical protein